MLHRAGHALPPIQTFGKISSNYRVTEPSDGTGTTAWTNTYEIGATSYIWQPWFGVWRAVGSITRLDSESDQESSSDILSGDVEVNLFHRSHFPLSAFVSLRDSRVEIQDLLEGSNDTRYLRMGAIQQYQDFAEGVFYVASYYRDQQDDLNSGETSVSNRLLFTADKRGEAHSLSGVASVDHNTSTFADSEFLSTQGTFSHVYTPDERLTVTTTANASMIDGDSDIQGASATQLGAGTQVLWRPDGDKWRVRGDLQFAREEAETDLGGSRFRDSYRARASARYELSSEASIFAEVGLDHQETDDITQTISFQNLSAVYDSRPIDLGRYAYTWSAGAGVGHETESDADSVFSQSVSLGHALSRTWLPELGGTPVPLVVSVGQDGSFLNQSDDDPEFQVVHRATLSAAHATERGSSYGQLSVFDIRTYGRDDTSTFSVNASASHNTGLTRYQSFDFISSYNFSSTTSSGLTVETDVASLELRYRNSRLFNVHRLTFESRLRASVTGLSVGAEDGTAIESEWDNQLDYRIGLLEVNGRFGVTQSGDQRNMLMILGITRRF